MQVSVIIVSYNTRRLLFECLKALTRGQMVNRLNQDFEVIVVDNASADNSVKMVKQDFPKIKLIESKENLGFAKANNQGAKQAGGKFLFFLNSDTQINNPALLLKMANYLKTNPQVGILAPQLLNSDGSLQKSGRNFPTFWRELCYFSGLWRLSPKAFSNFFDYSQHKDFSVVCEVQDGGGAAVMIRKNLFWKLGGWDEQFFMYYEDADLAKRVLRAGFKVVYFPTIKIVHHQGQSEKINPIAQRYLWESLPKYAQKWWPEWQAKLIHLWVQLKLSHQK